MTFVVYAGAAIACAGIALLVLCMVRARRLGQAAHDEAEAKRQMQKLVALNMGGLFMGFIGLGIVVAGVVLS